MNEFIDKLPTKVYHGTLSKYMDSLRAGIDIDIGSEYVDFGKGFYTTTHFEQAKSFANFLAKKYNLRQEKQRKYNKQIKLEAVKPMVGVYSIDKCSLKELIGKHFDDSTDEWAEFIFNNRLGKEYAHSDFNNLDKQFDFVYGCLADDKISTLIQDAKTGKISFEKFCEKIQPYDRFTQDQLSFHSLNAIKCLKLDEFII